MKDNNKNALIVNYTLMNHHIFRPEIQGQHSKLMLGLFHSHRPPVKICRLLNKNNLITGHDPPTITIKVFGTGKGQAKHVVV